MNKIPFLQLILLFFTINIYACSATSQTNNDKNVKEKQTEQIENKQQLKTDTSYSFIKTIPLPVGYQRIEVQQGSYAEYLRNLPLKQENNTVYLYNGQPKANQTAQFAVLKIDVGKRDLQQCADAVMRLRAEYLYEKKQFEDIHFNFTNGDRIDYRKYAAGYRTVIKGNKVSWVKKASKDTSYQTFRKYMELIFMYAGTYSLNKELKPVNLTDIQIGDVFIQTGNPYGHAILVVDIAIHRQTRKKIMMLTQSYMPAQEIHILKNPQNKQLSPWYFCDFENELQTPEWTFYKNNLKRF